MALKAKNVGLSGLFFFILLVCLVFPTRLCASSQSGVFKQWTLMPIEQLVEVGHNFANQPENADSAVFALSIACNRYDKNLSNKDKSEIAKAYNYLAWVYIFRYYDYAKAYECLIHSNDVVDETGTVLPSLYLNFAHLFSCIGEEGSDNSLKLKALDYMRKAFQVAVNAGNSNLVNTAFGNSITLAWETGKLKALAQDWNTYKHFQNTDAKEFTEFNLLYYKAMEAVVQHNYNAAQGYFDRQIRIMPDDEPHVRYICSAYCNKGKVCALQGNYEAAVENLKKSLSYGLRYDLKDVNVELTGLIADYYKQLGQADSAAKYRGQFLTLKESLLGYQQVAGIKELSFMDKLKTLNEQMDDSRRQRSRLSMALLIATLVVLGTGISLFILYRKNKQLRVSYQSLYNKNQEVLKLEDEYKKPKLEEKYKTSSLREDDKQQLFEKIEQTLSSSSDIYNSDFNLAQLAQLVNSNYKKVSQVINEKANCNFNALLNEYRVREACRRMNNEAVYGHLSLEGISSGVGFRARSSFLQAFKRFTGLTPSEYLRIQRSEAM